MSRVGRWNIHPLNWLWDAPFIGSLAFSLVRGAIVLAVANLAMGRWFKTRNGTVTFYMVAIGAMAALIAFSQPILANLDNLQSFLPSDQDWQQQAFRLGTISDRLQAYQGVLLNPRMYTRLARRDAERPRREGGIKPPLLEGPRPACKKLRCAQLVCSSASD